MLLKKAAPVVAATVVKKVQATQKPTTKVRTNKNRYIK